MLVIIELNEKSMDILHSLPVFCAHQEKKKMRLKSQRLSMMSICLRSSGLIHSIVERNEEKKSDHRSPTDTCVCEW